MQKHRLFLVAIFLIASSACSAVLSALFGSDFELKNSFLSLNIEQIRSQWPLIWEIRLPRSLGAWCAGALLGLSGAIAQGLFRNALADPFLLGSATGASLGVIALLALWSAAPAALSLAQALGVTGAAFIGALAAVALTLSLARGVAEPTRLLLAGVVVGVVLGALSSLLLSLHPELQVAAQGFLLGSTVFLSWDSVAMLAGVCLICLPLALAAARLLDALSLGEMSAASLGFPVAPLRLGLIALMALACGAAVAQTGLVAFVGLAAPHWVRSMVRVGHRGLLLLASLAGGLLLQVADLLSRLLLAPRELPVGVLTALVGGVYLLILMQRRDRMSLSQSL